MKQIDGSQTLLSFRLSCLNTPAPSSDEQCLSEAVLEAFQEHYLRYPDGRLNALQRAYEFPERLDGQGWRRVCCLRYCLEPLRQCVDYPLLEAPRVLHLNRP